MWKTAYQFMIYDRAKLIGILLGIVISVVLIGAQLGILDGFFEDNMGIIKNNQEYLFVVNKKSKSAISLVNIDNRVRYELQSISGVRKAHPIIVAGGKVKNPAGNTFDDMNLRGVEAPDFVGAPQKFQQGSNLNNLYVDGAVIVDESNLEDLENLKTGDYFSINDKNVFIKGISAGNAGMGDFNVVTTIDRARQLTGFNPNQVSVFLVETNSTDPEVNKQIAKDISESIPTVNAFTADEFRKITRNYLNTESSVTVIFIILVYFALFTGLIIVGLTMFSSVNDRIKDYGTIKAIGGNNKMIIQLIMLQSILYAIVGFILSIALLTGLKYLMNLVNQHMDLSLERLSLLMLATIVISIVGSYSSLRKILKLEPVQIFRM
jgi:putative ABC transport system permease protein